MKKILVLLLTVFHLNVFASHEVGAEMSYACTSTPNVYSVVLKVYRDCQGIQACSNCPTSLSPSCSRTINIVGASTPSGSGLPPSPCAGVSFGSATLTVVPVISGYDVVQLCNTAKTVCNNCGSRTPGTFTPGIEVYTFQGMVNLSSLPASCCLVSLGWQTCCRNNAITVLSSPGSLSLYAEAIVNRCVSPCNSSPTFYGDLDFVVAAGVDQVLTLDARDPDGDSLSYSRGAAMTSINTQAPYNSPYSPTVPFPYLGAPAQSPPATMPTGISMDPVTGLYRFRPMGNFVAPIIYQVTQWKKIGGLPTLMGITRREYQMYSTTVASNTNPSIVAYNNGVALSWGNSAFDTICVGQTYCRKFVSFDANTADTTDLSWSAPTSLVSNGATFTKNYNVATRASNGPREDSANFCWTPPAGAAANTLPYFVNFFTSDRRCPIKGKSLLNLGIVVKASPTASINKIKISAMVWKFKYTKTNSVAHNPGLTNWQIETGPNTGIYTNYNLDSVNSHTFISAGYHRIKLNLNMTCGFIQINDSIDVSNFSLDLLSITHVNCGFDSSGKIVVQASGGNPPYQYKINNNAFANKDTFFNLPAGNHKIVAKDSLNKLDSIFVIVNQQAPGISLSILSQKMPSCMGDSNGTLTLGVNNGISPFQYRMGLNPFQNSPQFTNLKAGVISFTVLDSMGCQKTQNLTLNQPQMLSLSISGLVHVKCKGDSSAFFLATGINGVPPYQYRINGGDFQYGNLFSNMYAGSKLVEIKDSNACVKSQTVTITEPLAITSTIATLEASCSSLPNGKAGVLVSGGKPPYTIAWQSSPIQYGNYATNLPAGKILVQISDSNTCPKTDSGMVGFKTVFQNESICVVTIDSSNGKARIIWTKTPDKGTAAYEIFAAPTSGGTALKIHSQAFGSTTDYTDIVSTPLPGGQSHFYYIKSVDSCLVASNLSLAHRAIQLSETHAGNTVNLSWTPYLGGLSYTGYKLFRTNSSGTGLIATLPVGTTAFIDSLGGSGSKTYILEAVSSSSCYAGIGIFANKVNVNALGLNSISATTSSYTLFPNPSTGKVTIQKKGNKDDILKVEVIDLKGSVLQVWEASVPQSEITMDLNGLAAGTYTAIVSNKNGQKQLMSFVLQK